MSEEYTGGDDTYPDGYGSPYEGRYGTGAYPEGDGTAGGGVEEQPDGRFAPGAGVWHPLAQGGEFDAEATMNTPFTGQLPDFEALRHGADPLAAPGHGYVPQTHLPPQASYDSAPPLTASGEWAVPSDQRPPLPESGTGEQWSVPFAPEDPAEMSGEYSVSQMIAPHEVAHPGYPEPAAYEDPAGYPEPVAYEPPAVFEAVPAFEETGTFELPVILDDPVAFEDPVVLEPPAAFPEPEEPAGPSEPAVEPVPGAPADEAAAAEYAEVPGSPEFAEGPEAAEFAEFAEGEDAAAPGDPHSEHPTASYVLTVNGADRPVTDAWLGESLLYVLRERLGLAGAKDGCEQGECGACSVQVDGRLVASCLMPAATAAGCEVRTVEGLARDGQPSDVQRALAECGAVQCGFCVPGLAMTVHDLLEGNHRPDRAGDPAGAVRQPVPLLRLPGGAGRGRLGRSPTARPPPSRPNRCSARRPPGSRTSPPANRTEPRHDRTRRGERDADDGVRRARTPARRGGGADPRAGRLPPAGGHRGQDQGASSPTRPTCGPRACCGPRCCAPRTRTPGSSRSTPRPPPRCPACTPSSPTADVPGDTVHGRRTADRPVFAADVVRHHGEPIAAVAADHPDTARLAAAAIVVEYEVLEPVTDPEKAFAAEPLHPDGNLIRHIPLRFGDPDTVGEVDRRGPVPGRPPGPGADRRRGRARRAAPGRRRRAVRRLHRPARRPRHSPPPASAWSRTG